MNEFGKIIETVFLSINNFLNQVEESGLCKNVSFSYDFAILTTNDDSLVAFANCLSRLCFNLQEMEKGLKISPPFYIGENISATLDPDNSQAEKDGFFVDDNLEELIPSISTNSDLYFNGVSLSHFDNNVSQPHCVTNECQNPSLSLYNKFQQQIVTEQNIYHSDTHNTFHLDTNPVPNASNLTNPNNTIISVAEASTGNKSNEINAVNMSSQCSQISLPYDSNQHIKNVSFQQITFDNPNNELRNCESHLQNLPVGYQSQQNSTAHVAKECRVMPYKNGRKEIYTCAFCHKKFLTPKRLTSHLQKVHNSPRNKTSNLSFQNCDFPIYSCKQCSWTSSTMSTFQEHPCFNSTTDNSKDKVNDFLLTTAELDQVKKFVCGCCRAEFRNLERMLYHLPRCVPGPYSCPSCPLNFPSVKDLNYHKGKIHKTEKCFNCLECGKQFLRKSSLRKHTVNHHESKSSPPGVPKPSFECDICSKQFIKQIFLTNHKIRMHNLTKKFLCQICGKKLMSSHSLKFHMDIHSGERKFECSHCQRRFLRKEKLVLHERIHTDERPFVCDKCPKSFVSRAKLNEHLRNHVAEKRFQCPRCVKNYASAWDVKRHAKKKHGADISNHQVKLVLKNQSKPT